MMVDSPISTLHVLTAKKVELSRNGQDIRIKITSVNLHSELSDVITEIHCSGESLKPLHINGVEVTCDEGIRFLLCS